MKISGTRHIQGNILAEKINYYNSYEIIDILNRFDYFINTIIDNSNTETIQIRKDISQEDEYTQHSMYNQFDVNAKLFHFKDYILKANIVSIFSFFEVSIRNISRICEKHSPKSNKIDDFKGNNGLVKINKFLKNETPSLTKHTEHWCKLMIWYKIRNDIVHNNSVITKFNKDIKYESLKYEIDYESNEEIFIFKDEIPVLSLLKYIKEYLKFIIDGINEEYNLIEHINIEY